jgi:hypothetical protein
MGRAISAGSVLPATTAADALRATTTTGHPAVRSELRPGTGSSRSETAASVVSTLQ